MPIGGGYDLQPAFNPDLPADEVQIYESPAHEQWEYVRNQLPIAQVPPGRLYAAGSIGNPDADGMTIADMHKEIERRWARELRWNDAMERLLDETRRYLRASYKRGSDIDAAHRLVVMITEMLGDGPNMPAKAPAVTNGDRELSGVSG